MASGGGDGKGRGGWQVKGGMASGGGDGKLCCRNKVSHM